ncbi:MAG: hypothetical protein H6834_05165 [Planctomycetes bacterium]|nr:hypothetical protein [Planctomycetota bacterium]
MSSDPVTTWRRILELIDDGQLERAAALYTRSSLANAEHDVVLDDATRTELSRLVPLVAQRLADLQDALREQERQVVRVRDAFPRSGGSVWVG